jgi:hypothetical protein
MLIKVEYKSEQEKVAAIELYSDLRLAEEHILLDGCYLVFADSEEPMPKDVKKEFSEIDQLWQLVGYALGLPVRE